MKKTLLLMACLWTCLLSFAEQGTTKWSAKVETQKVFIENKGQFDGLKVAGKVLFGTDGCENVFLFTKEGISYRLEKREMKDADQLENEGLSKEPLSMRAKVEREEEAEEAKEARISTVDMTWEGANPDVQVMAVEETNSYFNFGMAKGSINGVKTFKKVVYKNLYPGIDVEYIFHPQTGIEYSLILHPGADVSKVKMKYSGMSDLFITKAGEIHISTSFGDIIDHAPVTFYANNKSKIVTSSMVLQDDYVTFQLGYYDNSKTLVIDPWTTTPSLPSSNRAFYIKSDSLGNAYVYGGTTPFKLIKYGPTGNQIWTYSAAWDTSNNWFGALQVDRAGNAYITSGSVAAISKIDPTGTQVWTSSPGGILNSSEFWSMDFNCDQTQLLVGGTDYNPGGFLNGYIFNINMANGAVLSKVLVSTTAVDTICLPIFGCITQTDADEARAICFSPNGNFYFITLDSVGSLTPSFGMNFKIHQSYKFSYYNQYGYGYGQGHNGIRASLHYLYTSDGLTLQQRDLNTGAILATASIPNGVAQQASGIAIDTCGNVYVGTTKAVVKYTANLTYVTTMSTPDNVYDVSIGINGDVLACGQGFAVALAYSACPQILPICYRVFTAQLNSSNPACFGQCTGSATAATTNGTGPYRYLWSNGATTQNITNLCAGTYSVTVTDQANNSTAIASTTVAPASTFSASIATFPPACGQSNGKAVANVIAGGTAPYTYSWSGGVTNQTDSNLAPGNYSVTVTDAHSCSSSATATLAQSSALSLTLNSSAATCAGNNGSAGVTVTGATGPFQYSWSNGQTTGNITGLIAGNYTVTVVDTSSTASQFWSDDFSSGGTDWTLNTAGTRSNGAAGNRWIINNDANCNCTTGKYLHVTCNSTSFYCIGQSGQCTYVEVPNIGVGDYSTDVLAISPLISTLGRSNIQLSFNYLVAGNPGTDYGLVNLSSDGGTTWTALPTQYEGAASCTNVTVNIPSNYQNISTFRIAFEWINPAGTNANPPGFAIDSVSLTASVSNCPASGTVTVGTSNNFTLTAAATPATCSNNNGTATATPVGSSGYSYHWSNGGTSASISNLPSGNYTVTVSAGGCSVTASASVTATGGISLAKTSTGTTCGSNNGSANVSVASGTGPFTYSWSNGNTTNNITNVAAGNYIVTVSGSGGCTATASATIDSSSAITLQAFAGRAGCTSSGTANVTVLTGTGPFNYLWSNGGTQASINSLSAGNYSVTVTGASNCSASAADSVISTGTGITLTTASTASFCRTPTGSAHVTATTGNGPFSYSWSNGAATDTVLSIAGGNYTVTVTGNSGCSATANITVPTSGTVTITVNSTNADCGSNDGSTFAVIGGNLLSSYVWSNGATTDTITGLAPGTYTVTATTQGGCSATANTVINQSGTSVNLAQPAAVCQGDTAQVCAPSGFTTYHWNTGSTSMCINTTQGGNYYVTVTENGVCTATSNHVTVSFTAPTGISIAQHGDSLVATGATSYQWYFSNTPISGATGSFYIPTQDGNYYVQATDGNGCRETSNTTIVKTILGIDQVNAAGDIKVYPNPLANGNWHLDVTDEWLGANCEFYDAAGRLVYKTEIRSAQSEFEMNVAQGVYLMRINSAQKNYTFKLIKL